MRQQHITSHVQSLLTWQWTKRLLYWIVLSAGTMSECAFLLASIWISINASVHSFIRLIMPDSASQFVTYLATIAYVALPECILFLAVVKVIEHVRLYLYNRQDIASLVWAILYAAPTSIFLILSLATLGNAVASVDFRLPISLVIARALAAYMFAFVSLLYAQLGVPQERERLEQKDGLLAELDEVILALKQEHEKERVEAIQQNEMHLFRIEQEHGQRIAQIQQELDAYKSEAMHLKRNVFELKQKELSLNSEFVGGHETALQAVPEPIATWVDQGLKSVSIDAICQELSISKQKVLGAVKRGLLRKARHSQDKITIDSLLVWVNRDAAIMNKGKALSLVTVAIPVASNGHNKGD